MRNRMYGGVRGKETKIGRKTFVSLPTRLYLQLLSHRSTKAYLLKYYLEIKRRQLIERTWPSSISSGGQAPRSGGVEAEHLSSFLQITTLNGK